MMNRISTIIVVLLFFGCFISCSKNSESEETPPTDSNFKVTVNNGYGSGEYKVGDTVHIFSAHYTDKQLFGKWSGDIALLDGREEWHTWFVMPARAVVLTGSIKNGIDLP